MTPVSALYQQIRDAERQQPTVQQALTAGAQILEQALRAHGQDYDGFVWDLTNRHLR